MANELPDNETTPARQTYLDAEIRRKIDEEANKLADQDSEVKQAIRGALEAATDKNRDDETSIDSPSLHSAIQDVHKRVERLHSKQQNFKSDEVDAKGKAVLECYK